MSVNHSFGLWHCYSVKKDRWVLLGILLLATFFRFNDLNEPGLWLDEAAYTIAAQKPIISQLTNPIETLRNSIGSADPVLSGIPFSLSLKLGFSNFQARFPAAIFGILSVAIFYRLGRLLFGNIVGLIASLLLCISSFHILYSQEARSYSQLLFFTLASNWFFYLSITNKKISYWILYAVFTWAGISSNYLMAFVILIQGISLLIISLREIFFLKNSVRESVQIWILFLLSQLVIFLLRLPWLYDTLYWSGKTVGGSYSLDLVKAFKYSIETSISSHQVITVLLLMLSVSGLIFAWYYFPKSGIFLTCWIVLSIPITALGLWLVSQFFHPRYILWSLPAFLLAAAIGLGSVGQLIHNLFYRFNAHSRTLATRVGMVAMGLLILPVFASHLLQPMSKQNWPLIKLQEATTHIATNARNQDVIIGIPNTQYIQLYLQQIRPELDFTYIDPGTTILPQKLNGRWYVFYDAKQIPARWQTDLDHNRFNDIVVVHQEKECQLEECIVEAKTLLEEYAEVHPNSAIEEKTKIILSGLSNLPR